jgi:hypothetical protein
MRTTTLSLDRPTYYKNYYQRNKEYLRHRQRLRYYRNTPKFFDLLHEYNKILIEKKKLNRIEKCIDTKEKYNVGDTDSYFVISFL